MDKAQAMKVMAESHRETVEELEQEINYLKDVIKGNKVIVDIASDELKVLEKENKRYRERLEYMLDEVKDHKEKGLRIQHWALIKDLENALEDES